MGFLLLTGDELGHRLGAFPIVCRIMDLIGAKLNCARDVGQLDARFYRVIMVCIICAPGGACNAGVSMVIG